jgi:anti-anti-sigma factor
MKAKPVIVREVPERFTGEEAHRFFEAVEPFLQGVRPQVVLDFSRVSDLDSIGVETMLRCMKEVMKQNGELKLAAIPHRTGLILELMGADHLFEIYASRSEAVQSFHHFANYLPQYLVAASEAGGD